MIFPYSAMNKIANSVPPNSILKPETNSDSLSAKSKGDRLVSARIITNHRINKIKNPIKKGKDLFWMALSLKMFKELENSKILRITNENLTSYEMVCAMLR